MPRSWFSVQALAAGAAEIAIRGLIGEWGLTDRDFVAQVESLGNVNEIMLRINSRGGDVGDALAMFNYLRDHPANITVRVEGVAMSAATIVMMAGDKIIMPSNTVAMIHNPFMECDDGCCDPDPSTQHAIELFREALIETYASRTGLSREELGALLDEEKFMSAQEAKELGFCDEIELISAGKNAQAMLRVMACAMGIPDDVIDRVAAEATQSAPNDSLEGGDPASGEPAPASGSSNQPPATLATQIQALASDFGLKDHVSVFALATDIASVEAAQSAMATACEVRDLCNAVGMVGEAGRLIAKRASMAEARTDLQNLLAERGDAQTVNHHQPSPQAKPPQTAQAVWSKVIPTLAS